LLLGNVKKYGNTLSFRQSGIGFLNFPIPGNIGLMKRSWILDIVYNREIFEAAQLGYWYNYVTDVYTFRFSVMTETISL